MLKQFIRTITVNADGDIGFDVVTIICLFFFTVEIVLAIIVKEDYIWSFFFFLDAISTISLIFDI